MFHVLGVVFFLCGGMFRHQQHCQAFQDFSSNGSSCLLASIFTPFPPPVAWAWVLEVDPLTPSIWVFFNPIVIYGFLLLCDEKCRFFSSTFELPYLKLVQHCQLPFILVFPLVVSYPPPLGGTPRRGGRHQPHQTLKKSKKYKGGKKCHTMVAQSSPKMLEWHRSALKAWSILAWILGSRVDRRELMAFQVAILTSTVAT
jgi:hypothetical protein